MRPIGGYFEIECAQNPLYYDDGIYLNLCRSGLRYLIRALGLKKIHVPYFTCEVVFQAIDEEDCAIEKYRLDSSLMPVGSFSKDSFIVYNNYYGVLGKKVAELAQIYPNLIVDNAQAFYSTPKCRAAIYSPRKFFGLPDGGILRGKDIPKLQLNRGCSYNVMSHLLKRMDLGPQDGYSDFVKNDKSLEAYPLESMSGLTLNIMGNIDYSKAREIRLKNFRFLQKHIPTEFPIAMTEDDVPMVYPLYSENGTHIREELIRHSVFCAKYWPNVEYSDNQSMEFKLTNNVLSIPIDQRYNQEDMQRIVDIYKTVSHSVM